MFHRSGPDAPRLPHLPNLLRWPLRELLGGVASAGGEWGCKGATAPRSNSNVAEVTPNGGDGGATTRDHGGCSGGVSNGGSPGGREGGNSTCGDADASTTACNAFICDGATRVSRRGALTWWHLDDGGEAVLQVTLHHSLRNGVK